MRKFIDWLSEKLGASEKSKEPELAASSNEDGNNFEVERFQNTPNPDAGQFLLNEDVVASGTITFANADEAKNDAMATAIFKIFGIENVFIKQNFITVTKSPTIDWSVAVEPIREAIEANIKFYDKSDEEAEPAAKEIDPLEGIKVEDFPAFPNERKAEVIDALFDHAIRPALANDGGGLSLIGVENDTVKIHYQGACGSCPSASAGTLQYIENFLQETLGSNIKVQSM
ncbi:MAG: NifU family protein [Nitrospinales bacterium]